MGVRLTITNENNEILYYGSKLYGYAENLEESASLRYLWDVQGDFIRADLDIAEFEEFVDVMDIAWCVFRLCKLSVEQLTEFLRLYDEDLKKWQRDYTISKDVHIPKEVEYVWLGWG